ncbi:MAG: acyltransferase [Acidobacteriia bacterium]|nr:acyltransferase [Terriglobia bacterium]
MDAAVGLPQPGKLAGRLAAKDPAVLKYRADIDGLRALAVLSVVVYHAFPRVVTGGFAGVDIFFVISGYLISSIILGDLGKGAFSFRHFYARRIRRIFPALILVLAACFAVGWFTLLPREYEQLGKHIAGGAGFISNFVFWKEAGYFDKAAELKPLLHVWSLGIEEQFYLVWPLLLYIAWKARLNFFAITLPVLAVSFFLNVYTVRSDAVAAFYSPLARFWELMTGSALAYVALRGSAGWREAAWVRTLSPWVGLVLIGISVFALNTGLAFPGWWAVFPASGTFLLISAGPDAWLNRRVLANRALVAIGLVSYPFYLWHWPVLSFMRILGSGEPSRLARIGALAASLLAAWLTYRLIEKPIRSGKHGAATVAGLAVLMVAIGCAGFGTLEKRGLESRMRARGPQLLLKYEHLDTDLWRDARYGSCWLRMQETESTFADTCLDRGKSGPLVFLWGDSHAARLFTGLRKAAGDRYRLAQYARDACPPILDFGYENCISGNRFVLGKIREAKPDTLILFAVWNRYEQSWKPEQAPYQKLDRTLAELKGLGIPQVIVIGSPPQWKKDLPRNLVEFSSQDVPLHRVPQRLFFGLNTEARRASDALERLLQVRKDVEFVSAWKAFCDQDGCLTRVDEGVDGITTVDYGHLSERAAEYLVRRLPISGLKPAP